MKISKQIVDLREEHIEETNGSAWPGKRVGMRASNLLVTIFSGEPYIEYFTYLTYPFTFVC